MAVIKYKAADGTWKSISNYTVQPLTPVQETGASTTNVMSQDAVTKNLNAKADANNVYTKEQSDNKYYPKSSVYTKTECNDTFLSKTDANTTYAKKNELPTQLEIGTTATTAAAGNHTHDNVTTTAAGFMSSTDKTNLDNVKAFYDFMSGVNNVSSVANIPVDKHFVLASVSAGGSLSFNGTLAQNRELHIIVKNTSSSAIEISLSGTTPKNMTTLSIEGNAYGEINAINLGGTMYVRAAN